LFRLRCMIINLEKEDWETDLRIFPANRNNGQQYAYIHITLQGEHDRENIRYKLEAKKGSNEWAEGDYEVVNDKFSDMPSNGRYWIRFKIDASDVYFYRVTLYYDEHDILLASKTIYTPYKNPVYGESDFTDEPPVFHPFSGLDADEQAFYDKCQFAVLDYAASDYYLRVKSFAAWQGDDKLCLRVEYELTDSTETVWFAIDNGNYESYVADTKAEGIIPSGETTDDKIAFRDVFYITRALSDAVYA